MDYIDSLPWIRNLIEFVDRNDDRALASPIMTLKVFMETSDPSGVAKVRSVCVSWRPIVADKPNRASPMPLMRVRVVVEAMSSRAFAAHATSSFVLRGSSQLRLPTRVLWVPRMIRKVTPALLSTACAVVL